MNQENLFPFTYNKLQQQYKKALELGYVFITCQEYKKTEKKEFFYKLYQEGYVTKSFYHKFCVLKD